MVFLRAAQGSRGAPLCWARYAALIMRLTHSLFPSDVLRLQCFVDDPIAAIRGSARERRAIAATIMILWETLKCKLSYSKGQMGQLFLPPGLPDVPPLPLLCLAAEMPVF